MEFTSDKEMFSFATTENALPEWQRKLFKKYREEVQIHSKGQLFYKLDTLFPNENPLSKMQRILSFEPITKGSFAKGVSQVMRIFSNSSYTATASEKTMEYISQEQFSDQNLFSYFLEHWMNMALANDPNALVVVYPPAFSDKKSFEQVMFINSEDIVFQDIDTCIFRSEAESKVKYEFEKITPCNDVERFFDDAVHRYNLRRAKENTYAERMKAIYTDTVWHIFQKGKFYRMEKVNGNYEYEEYILPNTLYPPVMPVGGNSIDKVFESFLSPFIAFGNLALLQHSQHTAVNFNYSFPRMSEEQSDCDAPGCEEGRIICDVTTEYPDGFRACQACEGTGQRAVQSPYKVYIKKRDNSGLDGGNEALDSPVIQYYTPDVGILDYSKQEWKNYLEMAESAIFIQQKVQTGNVQSADSKQIDSEQMFSFLQGVSKRVYFVLRFVIQQEENYLNASPRQVSVEKPYSLAILTEHEAFLALNVILTSDAPDVIKGGQVDSFINKFVSQASPVRKAYRILQRVDLLLLKNDTQIQLLKANMVVTVGQWITHTLAYPVLMNMYLDDDQLFDAAPAVISENLKKALVPYLPITAALPLGALPVSNNALRDSVGGLTGMIEIAKAVASGLMDLDAAVAIVQDRFNLTEEQARKQLGTPKIADTANALDKVVSLV